MGNLCSIFHAHFDKLVALTNNHNKAVFLDKCMFWWQISKYTLNDDKIWFTRKLSEIAKELSISERSISRYLDEFEEKGFLERTCRLSASTKNNQFCVTKRLYIRVTDKLLHHVKFQSTAVSKNAEKENVCSFSNQHGKIEKDNLAESLYKEKDSNLVNNSTVSHEGNVNNLKNNLKPNSSTKTQHQYPIEPIIGERISERFKNYVKAVLKNVQTQHQAVITDPNKVFAEVIFSSTQDAQWRGIDNPHHRVNIIAKLLRENRWKTPKGFYNHWDVGQVFKAREKAKFEEEQAKKGLSSLPSNTPLNENRGYDEEQRIEDEYRYSPATWAKKDDPTKPIKRALLEVLNRIASEERYLTELENFMSLKKLPHNPEQLDTLARKIAGLYEEKEELLMSLKALCPNDIAA